MPGKPAARVTDPTTHGSPLSPGPGSPNVLIGGLPAWRTIVDQHACPATSVTGPDGVGNVIIGSPSVFINNQMACRIQDIVVEKPGLAMGPVNPIAVGCPTVLIGEAGSGQPAAVSPAAAKIEAKAPAPAAAATVGIGMPADPLTKWRQDKKDVIEKALAAQRKLLGAKKAELAKWDDAGRAKFKKAFGKDDEESRKAMQGRIDRMLGLNKNMTVDNFKPADPSKPDRFAYVYPNDDKHTVYLDQAFDKAPETGEDSKGGALAHEMSHFDDVGGTRDKFKDYNDDKPVYGQDASRQLAKAQPNLAMKHADSFEYYVEDIP